MNTAGAAIMKQRQTLTPTIYIPVNLYSRIVDMTKVEISGGNEYSYMGVIIPFNYDYTKTEEDNMDNISLNNMCLARIETSYQTGTSVTTTFAKNPNNPDGLLGIHEISDRLADLDPNAVSNCWIHTHPNNLAAQPSPRDVDQLKDYYATVATRSFNPYFISIIVNTSGEIYIKILHRDYEYVIPDIKIIEPRYIKSSPVADRLLDSKDYTIEELKEEFNKYFVKTTYTPPQQLRDYTQKFKSNKPTPNTAWGDYDDWVIPDYSDNDISYKTKSSWNNKVVSNPLEYMYRGVRLELKTDDVLIIGHRQYVATSYNTYIPTFVKTAATSFDKHKHLVRIDDLTLNSNEFRYKDHRKETPYTDEIGNLYYYFNIDTNEEVYWFVNEEGYIEQIPDSCVSSNIR